MPEQADLIIRNGWVLTMDPEDRLIENGAVAVRGDAVAAVGPAEDMAGWTAERTMDVRGGVIMPGLVNVHTHAAMTCFRGLADDLPLMTWLNDHIFPAESKLDAEGVYRGAVLACAEMILSGTTCFCDMYLFEDAAARAAADVGVRAVVGEVLYDFPSPNYGPIEKGFEYTKRLLNKWAGHPLISVAVEPHSPYLCSPDLLREAAAVARQNDAPLVIHISETEAEVSDIRKKYGKTPVAHLAEIGVLGPDLLACHCVALTAADIDLLKAHDVKVAHNPESNMKLASGIAPVPALLDAGICVGLGTDGCSSNNNLDMFAEMDAAAKLHKVKTMDPTAADAHTLLKMATIDGARALGLDTHIGSLEPGKKADIIIIDTHKPHLTPMYNPPSLLVYCVSGADVRTVLINGRTVMEDRELLSADVGAAMRHVNAVADRIRKG